MKVDAEHAAVNITTMLKFIRASQNHRLGDAPEGAQSGRQVAPRDLRSSSLADPAAAGGPVHPPAGTLGSARLVTGFVAKVQRSKARQQALREERLTKQQAAAAAKAKQAKSSHAKTSQRWSQVGGLVPVVSTATGMRTLVWANPVEVFRWDLCEEQVRDAALAHDVNQLRLALTTARDIAAKSGTPEFTMRLLRMEKNMRRQLLPEVVDKVQLLWEPAVAQQIQRFCDMLAMISLQQHGQGQWQTGQSARWNRTMIRGLMATPLAAVTEHSYTELYIRMSKALCKMEIGSAYRPGSLAPKPTLTSPKSPQPPSSRSLRAKSPKKTAEGSPEVAKRVKIAGVYKWDKVQALKSCKAAWLMDVARFSAPDAMDAW